MRISLTLMAFAGLVQVVPLNAESNHRISAKGGIAYGAVSSADLAEDNHIAPLDGAINGLLAIPDAPETYNCAASYQVKLLPTAGGDQSAGKPGCKATPSTMEVEYRLLNRFRLLYSRLYMPKATYNSQFITPTFTSGIVGFSRTINVYEMRHGRSSAGAGYLHPLTDSLRLGPTLRGVKEFSLYNVSPSSLSLLRAGTTTATGYFFQAGRRERILSGIAPGADLEFQLLKSMSLIVTYSRYILKGGMSESRASTTVASSGTVFAVSSPSVDATEARVSHSGYDAGLAFRFGSGSPGAFHFGFLKRKYLRNYESYYRLNTIFAGNLASQTINLLYVNALYTSHRYVQSEKFLEMKMELGLDL